MGRHSGQCGSSDNNSPDMGINSHPFRYREEGRGLEGL